MPIPDVAVFSFVPNTLWKVAHFEETFEKQLVDGVILVLVVTNKTHEVISRF